MTIEQRIPFRKVGVRVRPTHHSNKSPLSLSWRGKKSLLVDHQFPSVCHRRLRLGLRGPWLSTRLPHPQPTWYSTARLQGQHVYRRKWTLQEGWPVTQYNWVQKLTLHPKTSYIRGPYKRAALYLIPKTSIDVVPKYPSNTKYGINLHHANLRAEDLICRSGS